MPRYQQLAIELRGAILSGAMPPDQFPTENRLCQQFGVSRFTVREALRALQAEGLIERKRGSGTVVRPTARAGALHQPLSNAEEILQYARDTRIAFTLHGETALPPRLAEEIGVPADSRWLRLTGVRLRDGQEGPIAFTEVYIHASLAPAVARMDLSQGATFRQLEQLGGIRIAQVTQDIQAVAPGRAIAKMLGIGPRAPCLRILRCYVEASARILQIAVNHHPGDRFAYAMHVEVEG